MNERPSEWLKRAQQSDRETPAESFETFEIESTDEEPVTPETHAEYQKVYRSQLKHMVGKILAAQREAPIQETPPPSPDQVLGEEKA
jgi:hypothetical protein